MVEWIRWWWFSRRNTRCSVRPCHHKGVLYTVTVPVFGIAYEKRLMVLCPQHKTMVEMS